MNILNEELLNEIVCRIRIRCLVYVSESVYFFRLGKLTCLADPESLLVYKDTETFKVIQDIIVDCSRQGVSMPSHMVGTASKVVVFFSPFHCPFFGLK